MTQQKDLKRRIRERMEKTGESYTAARTHVLAQRPDVPPPAPDAEAPDAEAYDATAEPPRATIAVVEPRDVTEEAVALGIKCKVLATDGFDARRAVRQLHDLLLATDDADLAVLRAAVLWGRPPAKTGRGLRWTEDARSFLVRARAGLGGVGPNGWGVAFVCEGAMLIAMLSLMRDGAPTLWLRRVESASADELVLAAITLR